MLLSMNQSVSSALVLLGLCLGYIQLVAAQDFTTACDTGPDAFAVYRNKNIPQTCIDVPFEGEVVERCFYTYVPESCTKEEISEAPLVVDSHGMGSCAFWSSLYTGWMQKAEEECMVLVWPSGQTDPVSGSCFDTPGFLSRSEIPGGEDSFVTASVSQLQTYMTWINPPNTTGIEHQFQKFVYLTLFLLSFHKNSRLVAALVLIRSRLRLLIHSLSRWLLIPPSNLWEPKETSRSIPIAST